MFYETLFGDLPWPLRSLDTYIFGMLKNKPRFPYNKPVSKEV